LLGAVPFQIKLLSEFPDARLPEETGQTYAENALVKARTAARPPGALALGDDSGLEVDALGGAPGLHTARFGGPGLTDRARWELLLERLRDVPPDRRTARFRCVIALAGPAPRGGGVSGAGAGSARAAATTPCSSIRRSAARSARSPTRTSSA